VSELTLSSSGPAPAGATPAPGAAAALARHWPEYLIEAGGLGTFMASACLFAALLYHPRSPLHMIGDAMVGRLPMGLAMGLTAIAIVYSPWGQRSGAHLNPALTLTFWRLGKVEPWDALFYVAAQFIGAATGVAAAALVLRGAIAHPTIRYVVTVPGNHGAVVAFVAEVAISFILMTVVLTVSNRPAWNRFTGLVAGALVATYITLEAPLSGMSMNPARTLGSAVNASVWTGLWVYLVAPLLGMLAASRLYLLVSGAGTVRCAKLHHENVQRCIFRCGYHETEHSTAGSRRASAAA
jgi:aquaporin Z